MLHFNVNLLTISKVHTYEWNGNFLRETLLEHPEGLRHFDKQMSLYLLSPFLILIITFSTHQLVSSTFVCDEHDQNILLSVKTSFGSTPDLDTWSNSTDCCLFWAGVICDFNGKVSDLWIFGSNITGPIPSSIGNLKHLVSLHILFHQNLTGPIPQSLTKLRALKELEITWSALSGQIPSFLCELPNLYSIDLSANDLSGSIPDCFKSSVHIINFSQNRLSGQIPNSLMRGYSGNGTTLDLHQNKLTGKIPLSFCKLNFDILDLSYNKISGDASVVFGESKLTKKIMLSNNKLDFDMTSMSFPLTLTLLDLSYNRIRGSISPQIAKLQGLEVLQLSYNRLCGPIPSGSLMKTYDKSSFFHNKCLCGTPLRPCVRNFGSNHY